MKKKPILPILFFTLLFLSNPSIFACTGIRLKAKDGAVLYGRTLEWSAFDLKSRIMVIPREHTLPRLPRMESQAYHGRPSLGR